MVMNEIVQEKLKRIPTYPGVYQFFNSDKKIIPISYRIDQIKSPQNYNIAGFYEGSSTRTLKKYIDDFLLKSQI